MSLKKFCSFLRLDHALVDVYYDVVFCFHQVLLVTLVTALLAYPNPYSRYQNKTLMLLTESINSFLMSTAVSVHFRVRGHTC